MTNDFVQSVRRVSEIMMFENWLRFYFIAEEDGKLILRLPDEAEKRIQEKYAAFAGLLNELKDKEITHENSLQAVCMFVAANIDGDEAGARGERIFDSPLFQLEMQLFGSWVQAHEEQLDKTFMEFNTWLEMFLEWKKTPQVQEYLAQLKDGQQRTVHSCDTVQ